MVSLASVRFVMEIAACAPGHCAGAGSVASRPFGLKCRLEPEPRMSVLATVAASAGLPTMASRVPPRMVALSAATRRRLAWLMVIVFLPGRSSLHPDSRDVTGRIGRRFRRSRSAYCQFTTKGYVATRGNFIINGGGWREREAQTARRGRG